MRLLRDVHQNSSPKLSQDSVNMSNDLPFYDELTPRENALMQGYEFNYRWRSTATFSGIIRYHNENLERIREEMVKCPNAAFMAKLLRLVGMMEPEHSIQIVRRATGKHIKLLEMSKPKT